MHNPECEHCKTLKQIIIELVEDKCNFCQHFEADASDGRTACSKCWVATKSKYHHSRWKINKSDFPELLKRRIAE